MKFVDNPKYVCPYCNECLKKDSDANWRKGIPYCPGCGKKLLLCVKYHKISELVVDSKTPTNTTNGKIKPCSNKECGLFDHRYKMHCTPYRRPRKAMCNDYRA